jgi:DNA-binding beta-propeller fold protein YncE
MLPFLIILVVSMTWLQYSNPFISGTETKGPTDTSANQASNTTNVTPEIIDKKPGKEPQETPGTGPVLQIPVPNPKFNYTRISCSAAANPCSGTDGRDQMIGDSGFNDMYGKKGNDLMFGRGDDDRMSGNEGIDYMHGEDGVDRMSGGEGNDNINGGNGNDVIWGEPGNDNLYGGNGDDAMFGILGNDHMDGGAGNEIVMDGNEGDDNMYGGAGNDLMNGEAPSGSAVGNDRMDGGDGNDVMDGNAGNDNMNGGAGNDTVVGGEGDDLMYGGAFKDYLYGWKGADTIYGGDGNDKIYHYANTGIESSNPDGSKDSIDCGPGNDEVWINVQTDHDTAVNCETVHNEPVNQPTATGFYAFITKWGTQGSGDGQFDYPRGVAVDSSGDVYVVDLGNNRIQKFQLANPCPAGTTQITSGICFITKWGTLGSGDGQFNDPMAVTVDSSTHEVYVAEGDEGNNRIQKFTSDGTFITKWGSYGSGDGQFNDPGGVAVDSSGDVYVADRYNNRIQKFQLANPCPAGTTQITSGICFITKWGTYGSGDGQFNDPGGVAVDSSGDVYVTDRGNNRIQKFTGDGTFITKWGSYGSGDGQFNDPGDVAVDSSGDVYVADRYNNRIQKFQLANPCPAGTTQTTSGICFITKWGTQGSGNGQFDRPIGVAVDSSSGRVYVAERENYRIQVFSWKPILVANPIEPPVARE